MKSSVACTPKWLVVGAGLTGATLAQRIAEELDEEVAVIDRRAHVGGNACDEYDSHGVMVHGYGPHIFHTNDEGVFRYLGRFTDWRPYEHHVLAEVNDRLVPVPFNFNSLHLLFPTAEARDFERLLTETYGAGASVPILRMRETLNARIRRLADFIYENVFYGYTKKQWGLAPEALSPSVTGRVPVRLSRDDRYFQDRFQAIPRQGYAAMVLRMLRHRRIRLSLGVDFRDLGPALRPQRVIFTGPIDEYFDCMHGRLPYRSLRFEMRHQRGRGTAQPVAQVNYPNRHAYTRITEFKLITGQVCDGTTLAAEYPGEFRPGINEPYYPVPREENTVLYRKYDAEAAKLAGSVIFAGRLGEYRYLNMDQAVARALMLFRSVVAPRRAGKPSAPASAPAARAAR